MTFIAIASQLSQSNGKFNKVYSKLFKLNPDTLVRAMTSNLKNRKLFNQKELPELEFLSLQEK